jgi:hypothetical protein
LWWTLGAVLAAAILAYGVNQIPAIPSKLRRVVLPVLLPITVVLVLIFSLRTSTSASPVSSANPPPQVASEPRATSPIPWKEKMVRVASNVPMARSGGGVDTGLLVRRGETLQVTATGHVTYGQESVPTGECTGTAETDADGNRTVNGIKCPAKIDEYETLPTTPVGTLIAHIGDGPWFKVGARSRFTCDRDGELWLGHNDYYPSDNTGFFQVKISRQADSG